MEESAKQEKTTSRKPGVQRCRGLEQDEDSVSEKPQEHEIWVTVVMGTSAAS